jgi:threonine dehydrogenase-like Zn-dependent dehydrogenase
MKAIRFKVTIPRYAAGLALGKLYTPLLWSGLSCTYFDDIPEPDLPGPEWVKVKTRLGGICGTDLSNIHLKTSPYYSPFSSSPFTFGHENVGVIAEVGEGVKGWQIGQRVIAEPTLWCAPRGFSKEEWCEYCARGEVNQCMRVLEGDLRPALSLGFSADTGGSWSAYYLAHQSQLYAIPDSISDENALLVEPFACGLHAALNYFPDDNETVLILGAGAIGLMQLAALRALGSKARILVSARYPFQAEAAQKLGASEALTGKDLYEQVAAHTGASIQTPLIGKRFLEGGPDVVYECAGSAGALDDAIRMTKPRGQLVIVGVPGAANVDWAPIFDKELKVNGSYIYHHAEQLKGKTRRTYDIALELMQDGKVDLGWMVSRTYALEDYGRALRDLGNKKEHGIIKAAFGFI